MKSCHFQLEKLLQIRSIREQEAGAKLSSITSRIEGLQKEISRLDIMVKDIFSERNQLLQDISLLSAAQLKISALREKSKILVRELHELEITRSKAEFDYMDAFRKKSVVENLKDKKLEIFRKENLKNQYKATDGIVYTGF